MKNGEFKLLANDNGARAGVLQTAHGAIETPVFMPVGTKASVKSLDPDVVSRVGSQIILANTYHLYLSPGEDLIANMGGLHNFMQWKLPILTDSGGFQVFSLGAGKRREQAAGDRKQDEVIPEAKITEEGVEFRSHRDGSLHTITPEKSIEIQTKLGADIIMAFDECPPYPSSYEYYKESMERTHRWLERCIKAKEAGGSLQGAGNSTPARYANALLGGGYKQNSSKDQLLFGIIQGGMFNDLREQSAKFVASCNLPGIAIGGVANGGESRELMLKQIEWITPHLPDDKPRYLMGIGTPRDIIEFVARGIDMFDCVLPTRLARNGAAWVAEAGKGKRIQIKNAEYYKDASVLMADCECTTCTRFSRAYIHHLFIENEPLGMQLLSIHNIHLLTDITNKLRTAILNNNFKSVYNELLNIWG